MKSPFDQTSRDISVAAGCGQAYVGQLAVQGLVPHVLTSNGMRLYPRNAADIVRKIKAERLALRGRKRGA
jgi:hypothetical protein